MDDYAVPGRVLAHIKDARDRARADPSGCFDTEVGVPHSWSKRLPSHGRQFTSVEAWSSDMVRCPLHLCWSHSAPPVRLRMGVSVCGRQVLHVASPGLPDILPEHNRVESLAILSPVVVNPYAPGADARLAKLEGHASTQAQEDHAAGRHDRAQVHDFKREVELLYQQVGGGCPARC